MRLKNERNARLLPGALAALLARFGSRRKRDARLAFDSAPHLFNRMFSRSALMQVGSLRSQAMRFLNFRARSFENCYMFEKIIVFLFSIAIAFCLGSSDSFGQGDGTSKAASKAAGDAASSAKKSNLPPKANRSGGNPTSTSQRGGNRSANQASKGNSTGSPKQTAEQQSTSTNNCTENELLIRCDSPECNVSIDGKPQGITDINGELRVPTIPGKRNIVVSKNGYETAPSSVKISCGEPASVSVKLKPKPFEINLKTNLPNSEIFINDPPVLIGKSDENGFFKYRVETGTVYVQARKAGYLTDGKSVSPTAAQKEISLVLKPLPARITLTANVAGAFAQAVGEEKKYDLSEQFSLEPGRRKLIVTVLGYAPTTLELDLQPNQKIEKTLNLERLPIAELLNQAEQFLGKNSPAETLKLCQYVFETEPNNAVANRLVGAVYLNKQDYAKAEPYLSKALEGGETIALNIRRHYNEKFELSSGHDSCQGMLLLSNSSIEYRGLTAAENFKAPYNQIQIVGLQLKKNAALFLGLKITDAKGNKKEYNLFSPHNELSQDGKPFLEMIQRLVQKRKT